MLGGVDYRAAHWRIERWTLGLGAVASVTALRLTSVRAAFGVGVGSLFAWLHFRWLKRGITVLEAASIGQAPESARVPRRVYARFFGGFALLLIVLCAIFFYSLLPAAAVLAGLFTLVAGVLCEGVYQLSRSWSGAGQRLP
jgi:hypothetical protein